MSEDTNKLELQYYNADGAEVAIPFKLKFLSPELRVKIMKHDNLAQKAFKTLEIEMEGLRNNRQKLEDEIEVRIKKFIAENPTATEVEIDKQKGILSVEIVNEIAISDIDLVTKMKNQMYALTDKENIKLFHLIANRASVAETDREKFFSSPDNDFWQTVNIGKVIETNMFFRERNQVGG